SANVGAVRRVEPSKLPVTRKVSCDEFWSAECSHIRDVITERFGRFLVGSCRVVERWSSAAANCAERGRAACFAFPGTEHSNRFYLSPYKMILNWLQAA